MAELVASIPTLDPGARLLCGPGPSNVHPQVLEAMKRDRETITCLRSVLMKPEHFDWVERIWGLLSSAADEVVVVRH